MNKTQLKAMREMLSCEARGAFAVLPSSTLKDLSGHGWIEKIAGAWKSTQAGRQAVLAAGKSK